MNESHDTYIYRIDQNDLITCVSANWAEFVKPEEGYTGGSPAHIIGHPLWEFISGKEAQHLYKIVLQNVRESKRKVKLRFRCDAPNIRRYLLLTLIPLEESAVEFRSQILCVEPRDRVKLLDSAVKRSKEEFIKVCSMCKKIATAENEWEEAESAVNKLRIFEKETLPQVTHSLCKPCFDDAMAELDAINN